jgi:class 3 adenylate cyclase
MYLGRGDLHDTKYDALSISSPFFDLKSFSIRASRYSGASIDQEYCPFTIHLYPSDDMKNEFTSSTPIVMTIAAISIFVFTSIVFAIYDCKVERRQQTVMFTATRTNAIVSSLFPTAVRDKMMGNDKVRENKFHFPTRIPPIGPRASLSNDLSILLASDDDRTNNHSSTPLADLYPNTTVLFADIAGFTAWSSERSPCHVFTLLETLYGAIDKIAMMRKVFKVETIGDCYVAVTGLPEPDPKHAVTMTRFARDILHNMANVMEMLETKLGPETTDLKLRIGLNSGSTTAGVLRGEKSRFQLFGDTVNTAARMESNGAAGRIHMSQKTAELLIAAGKGAWITQRKDMIEAKGKGKMITYWLTFKRNSNGSLTSSNMDMSDVEKQIYLDCVNLNSAKICRLVDWNVTVFKELLHGIVANRLIDSNSSGDPITFSLSHGRDVTHTFDEENESIHLIHPKALSEKSSIAQVQLDGAVIDQLQRYILMVAYMYRSNPYHNFEHACHVVMSTLNLLNRMVNSDVTLVVSDKSINYINNHSKCQENAESGTTSSSSLIIFDPLTRLAIVLAALIHDIDPIRGSTTFSGRRLPQSTEGDDDTNSNSNVIVNESEKSPVDIAWTLFLQPEYADLQRCICKSESEFMKLHQLLINAVVATDIFCVEKKYQDDELSGKNSNNEEASAARLLQRDVVSLQANTIDNILQISYVAHTMQHWTIYQKWNHRLFHEMYGDYKCGTSPQDPSGRWYDNEISLFDHYIIPLIDKLKLCSGGVFAVVCDECMDCAIENLREWKIKGRDIVSHLVQNEEKCCNTQLSQQ